MCLDTVQYTVAYTGCVSVPSKQRHVRNLEDHINSVQITSLYVRSIPSPSAAARTAGWKWVAATPAPPTHLHQPRPLWGPPGPAGLCKWWGLHRGTGWQTAHPREGHWMGECVHMSYVESFNCQQHVHTLTYMATHVHMLRCSKSHSKSFTCLHSQRMSASASESTIWKALCVRCFLTICNSENTLMGLLALTVAGPLGVEVGSGHCSPRRTWEGEVGMGSH